MRIGLAFRVFFKTLSDAGFAKQAAAVLAGDAPAALPSPERQEAARKPAKTAPARSDAVTLLALLQREARLVDMVKEPLGDYSDAQVGAAARDVLRDCGQVFDRLFELAPLVEQEEGSEVEVPEGYDTGRFHLTGNVSGEPPFHGRLVHHGWKATRCEVPVWTGAEQSKLVVAPEEVEIA